MYIHIKVQKIEKCETGCSQYFLNQLFNHKVSASYPVFALASTYVRLVDAAIVEYNLGAEKLQEFWNTHTSFNLSAMHRSMSHFESCLSNTCRAINCYRKLKRNKERDPLSIVLNMEKPNFNTNTVADKFREMRNDIHHLEELVIDGRLQEGQPFALMSDGIETPHPTEVQQTIKTIDRLVIGEREVFFSEFADCLKEMASIAVKIAKFQPSQVGQGKHI